MMPNEIAAKYLSIPTKKSQGLLCYVLVGTIGILQLKAELKPVTANKVVKIKYLLVYYLKTKYLKNLYFCAMN